MNNKLVVVITLITLSLVFTSCSSIPKAPPPVFYNLSDISVNGTVSNITQTIIDNNTIIIYNPQGLSYTKSGLTEGQIQITFPHELTDAWATIEIEGRGTTDSSVGKLILYGYAKADGSGWDWETSKIDLYSQGTDFIFNDISTTYKCGFQASTNPPKIICGQATFFGSTDWTNLSFAVNKVTLYGANTSLDWSTGWDLTFYTGMAGGSATANYREYWNDDNDGASSSLDADTVDGIHASSFHKNNQISDYGNYTGSVDESGLWHGQHLTDAPYQETWFENRSSALVIGDITGDGVFTTLLSSSGTTNALWSNTKKGYDFQGWERIPVLAGTETITANSVPRFTDTNGSFVNTSTMTIDDEGNVNVEGISSSLVPHMEGFITERQSVAVADTWYNITWNTTLSEAEGFTFTNNETLTALYEGHYNIIYKLSIQDSNSATSNKLALRIINDDGEVIGSYEDFSTSKQDTNEPIINAAHIHLQKGYNLTMQYLGSSTEVSIYSDNEYSDYKNIHGWAYIERTHANS